MCSISGVINGDLKTLKKMISTQSHRAPDDQGVFVENNIFIGMGRLKIIDLKSENLCPYIDDDIVVSYNGEIYNYIELKKELIKLKWKFKTNSDLEVLVKSWKQWGFKIFEKLNGMFAFCIYEKKKKRLILSRDIAGEKPLYYSKVGKKFYFSSEAKAIVSVCNNELSRDNKIYKAFQHCINETLWKNVFQLPAANYLVFNLNTLQFKTKEYWTFKPIKIDLKEPDEQFSELLENSIKIRLRSDVKFALYYSKGMDSSLISTFYEFKNKFFFNDQKNWKADFLKKFKKISYHLDVPVGSLSSYPLWKLAERAKKSKAKVVISGEGADELFGGYTRYLPVSQEWELKNKFTSYQYLFNKFYDEYIDSFAKITSRNDDIELVKQTIKPHFEKFDDPINAMGYSDFKIVMPSLLQMGDRMAAAHGIENRCPFLDRNLIEFAFSLPHYLKIKNLEQKLLIRNLLMKKNFFSPLKLQKKGLTITFNKWFNISDWSRDYYFNMLNENWKASFVLKNKKKYA